MRFNELFTRHRKTEPSSVILLRILIMILLISSLIGYFTILIIEVTNDDPIIADTIIEATEIPIPDMQFQFRYPFELSCFFIRSKEMNLDNSCTDYFEQLEVSSEDNVYIKHFKNMQNLKYVKPEIDENAIRAVSVIAKIVDPNHNSTRSHDLMIFSASDSETIPTPPMSDYDEANLDKMPAIIYFMVKNEWSLIQFTRNIREQIIPSFKDHFGFEPTYYKQNYLLANSQNIPLDFEVGEIFASQITLTVQNFLITKETELRHETNFSMLALVGGAWSLAAALYAALFGVDLIRPWGWVQFYCCGVRKKARNKLIKSLPVIPLINNSERPQPPTSRDISRDEHAALQRRVDALEVFLREYVVDVNYLEAVRVVKISGYPDIEIRYPTSFDFLLNYIFLKNYFQSSIATLSSISGINMKRKKRLKILFLNNYETPPEWKIIDSMAEVQDFYSDVIRLNFIKVYEIGPKN
ncbi:10170_t:CDS:10 [Funneliformis caledonium]|uniref:10170_t:CDS:1 n=1 Tax=Funneliformis caledonium TaxID=1117310 RepID=A0A9N9DW64_9GLOM|nr:10170_t:CDS:10 [Funneliformis caledonium]